MGKKLNNQEQIFADQYLISMNAYQSAKVAKYAESTALKKSGLWVGKSRNNPKPHVADYIQANLAKRCEKAGVTGQMVIDELVKIGFSNIQDFVGVGNRIKDISAIPRDMATAIESIAVDDKGKVKIKCHSKISALQDLGKVCGIYEADNKQQAATLADLLKVLKE